jgi:hypothetical protein
MENHHHVAQADTYTGPIHPEVTATLGDSCFQYGINPRSVQEEITDKYQIQLTTVPSVIEAGHPVRLTFAIKQNQEQLPLTISHEMKVQVMIVSEDLNWFQHIHPVQQTDGTYAVTQTFHNGGKYLLYTDLKSIDMEQVPHMLEIEAKGYYMKSREVVTNKVISYSEPYSIILENVKDFETERMQPVRISIQKDGKKLKHGEVDQYLGPSAHIVMIGKADKDLVHIHPVTHQDFPIYAEVDIQKAGMYKMWVQFKIHGKVHTADFNINVNPGKESQKKVQFHQL